MSLVATSAKQTVGRYALHQQIASGGMATVHVGRLMGPVGFARTVAIKRLHSHFANDPEFVAMFMDEAHLAARIRHPNVVSISDVVAEKGELLLVMDYIAGESLSKLMRAHRGPSAGAHEQRGDPVDPRVVIKIMTDVLAGLHAAHEVKDDEGAPLGVVHRDVSPQNILVGADGVAQLIDFGVAKAAGRIQTTREGQLKGKLGYMAPEQIELGVVDRRTDIYSAAVVLWEALTSERLFAGTEANLMYAVLHSTIEPPSSRRAGLSPELDRVVMRALARDPAARYASALELADALEAATSPASAREVARWVQATCADALRSRGELVAEVESDSALFAEPSPQPPPGALFAEQPWGDRAASQSRVKVGALAASAVLLGGVLIALAVLLLRSPASEADGADSASSIPTAGDPAGADSPRPGPAENVSNPNEFPSEPLEAGAGVAPEPTGGAAASAAAPTPKPAVQGPPKAPATGNGLSGAERKEKYGF